MMKKIVKISSLLLLLVGLAVAYIYFGVFEQKVNTDGKESVYFYVKSQSTLDDLVDGLLQEKIVDSKAKFAWLAELRNLKGNIYAGRYTIISGMSWTDLVIYLRQGKIDEVQVTFNNVRTLKQLAEKVSLQIEASESDLLEQLVNEELVAERGYQQETFLAVFIPNTYKMYWNSSAKEFVDRMMMEYKRFWNKARMAKAKAINLSPVEVSVLASIVQSEQNRFSDEWPIIAGLYLNRLKKGMKLQSDPTVIYAWGDFTIRRVWNKHLTIDNPYNTYKFTGLPPGPIRVPSSSVLDAVLNYTKHKYIFMCANPKIGGKHSFATTLAGHNLNAAKYRAFMRKSKIR
tara:strand:- start:3496 stop:4527 length:1032 start_codon:yes stop_codon:yes gene_type:complete